MAKYAHTAVIWIHLNCSIANEGNNTCRWQTMHMNYTKGWYVVQVILQA